jgi:hypothetical protein
MFYDKKTCTGRDLYQKMWNRVKGLINLENNNSSNGKEDPIVGKDGHWPFRLRVVTHTGNGCGYSCNSS